jgi:hypothetical protein
VGAVHPTRLISARRSKDHVICVAEEDIDGLIIMTYGGD